MRLVLVDLSLALRSVLRQGHRTAIAMIAVSVGVIAMILSAGFIEWLMEGMRESTIHSQLGHIQVVRPGYVEKGTSDPYKYLIVGEKDAMQAMQAEKGMEALAPRLAFSGLLSLGDTTLTFIGQGVAPEAEAKLSTSVTIISGENLDPADPKGVILGRGLATNVGAKVGDTVVMMANTAAGSINAVEGRVRGIFSSVSKAYDDAALRVPITLGQSLIRADGAHQWLLLIDDTAHTDSMLRGLRSRFDESKFEFVPWYRLADFYNKTRELFGRQVAVVQGIIAVIFVLSISNTLSMSVLERTSEIGTCMALGLRRRRILRIFVSEGLMLGVVGGLTGVILGCIAALVISRIGIPLPPPPGMDKGFDGHINLTLRVVFDALALAVGAAVVSSLYPAWKASRLVIVDALRRNR